jgi:hypothetical protein
MRTDNTDGRICLMWVTSTDVVYGIDLLRLALSR